MNHHFYCSHCQHTFSDKGIKVERKDPILGKVWKITANCPDCDLPAYEKKTHLGSNKNFGNDFSDQSQSCATGRCPFVQ